MRLTAEKLALVLLLGAPLGAAVAEENKDASVSGPVAPPSQVVVPNAKYDDLALFSRVIQFVDKQYVDKVKTRDLVYGAIKGMLETLDPHSNFMPPDIYSQLKSDTSGKFGGLGIEVWVNKDGVLTVVTPMEGTPAWKAGIKPGDRIIKIDGASTKGMSIMEATSKIRGQVGTEIRFTIAREDRPKPIEVTMKRVMIDVKSVKHELLSAGYGYIRLNHFQEKSSKEVRSALKKIESDGKLKGLVLDLRNNPGGLLDEAVETTNLFVDSGVIVSTIGREGEKDVKHARSGLARTDFPIVVLVNGSSASAAEIVAGALKDHQRAIVAGQRTFGKGSVQTVIPLAEDVGLKLTIARYYTPNGISIQAKGIEPDIFLDDLDPEAVKRLRRKARAVSEADLKNHIESDDGVEIKAGAAQEDDARQADAKDAPPRPLAPKDDYQVQQALNYLKTMNFKGPQAPVLSLQRSEKN